MIPKNKLIEIDSVTKTVQNLKTRVLMERNDCLQDIEDAHRKAAENISQSLIKNKLMSMTIYKDALSDETILMGTVSLVEPGLSAVMVHDEHIVVENQRFDEDDVIKAIKETYPERFI